MANETILITGASSDIGRALLSRLLTRYDSATLLAHSFSAGDKLREIEILAQGRVRLLEADFSQRASVTAMCDQIEAEVGTPTAIVHLPALALVYERFTKFDWARFEADFAVQVESAIVILQRFLPKMAKLPRARVVFMLSSAVHGAAPKYMSMYTTIKYAQLGLMRSLAADYAATPVRINGVSPSMVETQFLQNLGDVAVQMAASSNPLQRNATPNDILGVIELLLSPDADFMQGVSIPVAAGMVV